MAINRASMPEQFVTTDRELPRRTAMVVGGFVVALVSLVIGSIAIAQVWLGPAAAEAGAAASPTLQPWESTAMILLGGLGFAAGAALVGIGMGRWGSPRPPTSDADYTGPGDVHDTPDPPRVV